MAILSMFDTKIIGMSISLVRAKLYLTHTSKQVVYHIIKRCIYTDDQYYNHWEKEITVMLIDWQDITLKPKDKRLPRKLMIEAIDGWLESPNELEIRINSLVKHDRLQKRYIAPYDLDVLYSQIRNLIETIVTDVANNEFIAFNKDNYNIPQFRDFV